MKFSKILIANRGEIACRVIRTARQLGFQTVAVYSDADANSPHLSLADQACRLGPAPAEQSYLNIDALLAAAQATGADAIHPGYGFLSERPDFAQACVDAGLVFIGPSPASMAAMGSKAEAKRRMLAAGVPCVPGYLGEQQDEAILQERALRLGFPLLVKAVAGGGGRGMRVVQDESQLLAALASARREAQSAFGDGTLMLERLIAGGRHIEIQIFADSQGACIHLGERDCTTQRRRQKVIEEAPSPVLTEARREAMGRDAVAAAQAVSYVGAGTVEFMLDAQGQHYFLEMNTRLQVEHPVTEMITGLDLVAWQLRVAAGQALPLRQDEVRFSGHAIEVRLYAEDPYSKPEAFAPQTGPIRWWRPHLAQQAGLRVDDGIREGGEVRPFYDAMLAKLIVHGRDRQDAIQRLAAALADSPLLGLNNNGRFLRDLLLHPDFGAARLDTRSLDVWAEQGAALLESPKPEDQDWLVAAGLLALAQGPVGARSPGLASYALSLRCGEEERRITVSAQGLKASLELAGERHSFESLGPDAQGRHIVRLNGVQRHCIAWLQGQEITLSREAANWTFAEASAYPEQADDADPAFARAPVAGVVAQLLVKPGQAVTKDQPLLSVEAMKMEMWLTAGRAGRVRCVHASVGAAVAAQALLVELDDDEQQGASA
ncbi:carbamoyl-phosphate synthase subunit L [Paucibacter sp. KBW04]|uniref:acetyl/propionyl/methylcrotonyl-CoA carboxylase subunit alpha n=1 Tax=Paucibacter sp. KBW04 TaxID=2153361 RepID=UPI000F5661F3|nr:biotin carboxylase N-terminal domain-containing protein [Paucibacter sp. KBW04]RQO55504.1 carbamoyl-phosphate synthase subunit L [Paucibacter sp. KBW04]